jgi:hypothetical protein
MKLQHKTQTFSHPSLSTFLFFLCDVDIFFIFSTLFIYCDLVSRHIFSLALTQYRSHAYICVATRAFHRLQCPSVVIKKKSVVVSPGVGGVDPDIDRCLEAGVEQRGCVRWCGTA